MPRLAAAKVLPLLLVGVAMAHHGHGRGVTYAYLTLALFCFESWAGVPGPGESLLIAYGILAGKGHLDVAYVLLAAFGGAMFGGVVGWQVGVHAGRRVIDGPGPLRRWRRSALDHGEEIYARFSAPAVVLAPSWISGIHHVRASVFLPWNAVGSLMWALGIGLAAYFVGPPVVHFLAEEGVVVAGLFIVLVVVGVTLTRRRRRRQLSSRSAPRMLGPGEKR